MQPQLRKHRDCGTKPLSERIHKPVVKMVSITFKKGAPGLPSARYDQSKRSLLPE